MNPTIAIIMGIPLHTLLVIKFAKKQKKKKNLILFPVLR